MKTINDIVYNLIEETPIKRYLEKDSSLIVSKQVKDEFGLINDKIEFHIYDFNRNLLQSKYEYKNYRVEDSYTSNSNQTQTLYFNPVVDVLESGYKYGSYILVYNFFRTLFSKDLFIKEISSDRTELRLASNSISDSFVEANALLIINEINRDPYLKDYLLNFGDNNVALVLNLALDNTFQNKEILIKLYEPLDEQFDLKSICSIDEEITSAHEIDIELDKIFKTDPPKKLRGANFDIDLDDRHQLETQYENKTQLLSNLSYSSSLNNVLLKKSYEINLDYSNFNDFVHFGSAKERVLNFYYKVNLIETLQTRLKTTNISGSGYNLQNKTLTQQNIKNIFEKFDGYENYLYTQFPTISGSLYSTTSSQAQTWLGSDDVNSIYYGALLNSASLYDEENKNNLVYSIPEYLRIDEQNKPYEIFLNMVGQHFDQIWTYIKKSTDIYKANNNLEKGISKDLVYEVLKNFGIKIYNTNDYSFFDSFKTSQISSSLAIDDVFTYSNEDLDSELYKRIYHNLPYLLKTKGTERGIRSLMSIYGIPDTIYRINEFGGFEKENLTTVNSDSFSNYSLKIVSGSYISTSFKTSGSLELPHSLHLRYKSKISQSQNLFRIYSGSTDFVKIDFINISGINSNVRLTVISGSNTYSSITPSVPILSGNYFDFNVNFEPSKVVLNVQTNIDGKVGYDVTSSLSFTNYYNTLNLNNSLIFRTGTNLTGSIQSLQFHSSSKSNLEIDAHTLNPISTEPYSSLLKEFPLGSDFKKYNHSVTSSLNGVTYTNFSSSSYSINYENIYYNSPNVGIRTVVNDKINYTTSSLEDNILSAVKSFQNKDVYKTNTLNLLEIAFSPTYEINEDIISAYGTLNLDNYIGNPQDNYSSSYSDLDVLRNQYFLKYISTYNYQDYFRVVKSLDNSLFKMLKDFVPFRANLSTGIIIKQHILERNKIKQLPIETEFFDWNIQINPSLLTADFNSLYNISGSQINYLDEFYVKNYNKYLKSTKKIQTDFTKSNFNILGEPVLLNIFDRSDDLSYKFSRHDGCKVSSYQENVYTLGDKSYGKTPNIETYYGKMGIFTEIITNPILPSKSFVHLRYLVDKDGNLTELNRNNKNIYEIQNTFKDSSTSTISLFDNTKYDSQKSLDGAKDIFVSGYDYSPIVYFKQGENNLKFNYLENQQQTTNTFLYKNSTNVDITDKKFVYNIFSNKVVDSSNDFITGSVYNETFPYYKIPSDGSYTFYLKVPLLITLTKNDSKVAYSLTLYKNSPLNSTKVIDRISAEFTNSFANSPLKFKSIGNPLSPNEQERIRFNNHWSNEINSLTENLPFVSNATWSESSSGTDNIGFYIIYENSANQLSGKVYNIAGEFRDYYYNPTEILFNLELPTKKDINSLFLENYFNTGDKIYVVLQQDELNAQENVANTVVLKSENRISLNAGGEIISQNTSFINSILGNKILFNKDVSNFYNKGVFIAEESQLYSQFGDVNNVFSFRKGDLISIKNSLDNRVTTYEISTVTFYDDGRIGCYIKDEFPSNLTSQTFSEIAFIKKQVDETVVILNFKKTKGSTSYGYLIPSAINPNVLSNINKINKEVKAKLINENDINIIPYGV